MTSIKISNLPPAPAGTGTGTSQGTDLFPATDTTDTTSSSSGTTKKYTLAEIYNWMLQAQGLTVYDAVLVATTGALTATYDNGTDGVGATLTNSTTQSALVIDDVTMVVGDRVLVWQQTDSTENGIYAVTDIGSSSTNWIMTRATDYDEPDEIVQYGVMLVNQGDTYASKLFQETGEGPFTIGSTAITFALYTGGTLQVPVLLSQGGTSASLTASNGGIFYSTDSAGAILAGTATANQILQSGATAAPSWSTTTYPVTNAINTIMYASSANVLDVITPVNSAVLISNSSGAPSWSSTMLNGQVIIGSTGSTPAAATLTEGTGISITNGAGSITIAADSAALVSSITGTANQVLANGTSASPQVGAVTLTLPQDIATSSDVDFGTITTSGDIQTTAGTLISGQSAGGSTGTLYLNSDTASTGALQMIAEANSGNYVNTLQNASTTAARTWTLPDESGTIALTSDISSSLGYYSFATNVMTMTDPGFTLPMGFSANSGLYSFEYTAGDATGGATGVPAITLAMAGSNGYINCMSWRGGGFIPSFNLMTSASTVIGTPSAVSVGQVLGSYSFQGDNGSYFTTAAEIRAIVSDAIAGNDGIPGDLQFYTVNTSGTFTLGMTLTNAQILTLANPLPTGSGGLGVTTTPSNGQIPIGNGSGYTVATLTAGSNVTITNGAGSITISVTGGGLSTVSISGTSQSGSVSTKYIALNAGQTTLTLPSVFDVGDIIILVGASSNTGGWVLQAAAGDTIQVLNSATSAGGTVTSTAQAGECISIVCDVANTSWVVSSFVSTLLTTA